MTLYYFDASALVKYYVTEPGSVWVRQIIDEQDSKTGSMRYLILIAEITRVEVAAGLAVIERVGRISRSQRDREYRRFISQLIHHYTVIPLATNDLETAAHLTQHHPLKAYDAVQLAVALRHHQTLITHGLSLTFVSGDNALVTAAQTEGLLTDNPFDHVLPQDAPGGTG